MNGGTPSTNKPYYDGYIPWATVDDIKRRIYTTQKLITDLGLRNSSAKF